MKSRNPFALGIAQLLAVRSEVKDPKIRAELKYSIAALRALGRIKTDERGNASISEMEPVLPILLRARRAQERRGEMIGIQMGDDPNEARMVEEALRKKNKKLRADNAALLNVLEKARAVIGWPIGSEYGEDAKAELAEAIKAAGDAGL